MTRQVLIGDFHKVIVLLLYSHCVEVKVFVDLNSDAYHVHRKDVCCSFALCTMSAIHPIAAIFRPVAAFSFLRTLQFLALDAPLKLVFMLSGTLPVPMQFLQVAH